MPAYTKADEKRQQTGKVLHDLIDRANQEGVFARLTIDIQDGILAANKGLSVQQHYNLASIGTVDLRGV